MVIFNSRILILVKQNGNLDLPGGRIKGNEKSRCCLWREIYEETSLIAKIKIPVSSWSFYKTPQKYIKGVTYICTSNSSKIVISDEHSDFF